MNTPHEPSIQRAGQPAKKPYSTPSLQAYGDLRDLTLASSPGTYESGRGFNYRTPGLDEPTTDFAPSGGPSVAP